MSAVFSEDIEALQNARMASQRADQNRLLTMRKRLMDACPATTTPAAVTSSKNQAFSLLSSLRQRSCAPVSDVSVSTNGMAVVSSWDGTASLWDVNRWREQGAAPVALMAESICSHIGGTAEKFAASAIVQAKFSPATPSLLGTAAGTGVHLWKYEIGKCEHLAFLDSMAVVNALDFHPIQSLVCTASHNYALIWDAEEHTKLRNLPCGDVEVTAARYLGSSDTYTYLLATAQLSGAMRVWDLRRPKQVQRLEAPDAATCLDCHDSSHLLAIGYSSGQVSVLDMRKWGEVMRFDAQTCLRSLAISRCGRSLAAGGSDGELLIYDIEKRCLAFEAHHHSDAVTGLAWGERLGWASCSSYLMCASLDSKWSCWGKVL